MEGLSCEMRGWEEFMKTGEKVLGGSGFRIERFILHLISRSLNRNED